MKKLLIGSMAVLFILGLWILSGRNVDLEEPSAAEIWSREAWTAMTPYGVAEAHDTSTILRKNPVIYWGYEADGSIDLNAGTYQNTINSSCEPLIFLTVQNTEDTSDNLYSAHLKNRHDFDAVTYEVRKSDNGTVTDVTATVPVMWVVFGWR